MPRLRRPLLAVAAVAAGAAAGVLGSFVHPLRLLGVPVGLAVGLALTGAVVAGAGAATAGRGGAAAAGVGWLLPVLALSAPRPEGDLVVAGNPLGYAWLLGGLVVVGGGLALPYAGRTVPEAPTAPPAGDR